jgi:hypothetical protein
MNKSLLIACGIVLAGMASAQSFTVASFRDPSNSASSPVFTVGNTQVTGAWSGSNLNLEFGAPGISGTVLNNVTMTSSVISRTGPTGFGQVGTLGAGSFTFNQVGNTNPVFTISFSSGQIVEPAGLGGSYIVFSNVVFGGSALAGVSNGPASSWVNTQFSFSFANPATLQNGDRTYTSSFTSSAVPEPITMGLLALGLGGLVARRKRA